MIHIAILRGVNVSGKNRIKMVELREAIQNCGFEKVTTYIQSGNIVFSSRKNSLTSITEDIKKAILKTFSLNIELLVFNYIYFEKTIINCPFSNEELDHLYITFLPTSPEKIPYDEIDKVLQKGERYQIIDNLIYIYCPSGYGKTKINNSFFEKKFKTCCTTRNWKTAKKLWEISQKI